MMNKTMKAVVTMGSGGMEQLVYKDVPIPELQANEVLVRVLAAGVNNTEINTRLGWYSAKVSESTNNMADNVDQLALADGGWNAATPFPLIQGTDCCGEVLKTAENHDQHLVGKRVLIRPCIRVNGFGSLDNIWMASDFDGAFAQYVKVWATEVFPIDSTWQDDELASIPCAYGTAENMLHRAQVIQGERVLIMGASGGVGSAAVQLAKRRGAHIIAVASLKNHAQLKKMGADSVFDREANLVKELGESSIDVVIDNVAGDKFGRALQILKRGGRLVTSGAIAGPIVSLDLRQLYLKDIGLIGTTAWDEPVFPNLIRYIENNEIKPLVARTYALENIVEAQTEFLKKQHFGKFVLLPS
tara:strand:+ start:51047 stop:52120 length:1074 start_codon:yes stop_codon:yes gene_type:complete